ncbi:MAG: PilZ domain-containing protein [Deltaproteobacteria bacterium]
MARDNLINRRREHRLPYFDKVIFTDGTKNMTAHAINISRGGMFVATLDAFPIESFGHIAFILSTHSRSLCIKARVAHIIYDIQRSEVECGMGLQFMELSQHQYNLLNQHILSEQNNYLELREILKEERPDPVTLKKLKSQLPGLEHYDLLGLRYRINRICTLFDNPLMSNPLTAA